MELRKDLFIFILISGLIIPIIQVLAICPICTVAVGAGIGFSRWLGVDDSITGLWIGGLTISMIVWGNSWISSRRITSKGWSILARIAYYLLVLVPLYYVGIFDSIFLGKVDNLFIGFATGSLGFWFCSDLYYYLKERNGNRAYFPFQKVLMPIAPLIICSIIFYFLTR
ncbi:MAG: hypothetical protein PHW52_03880 [Candidatus Pacebacteria bacterium]|nr:hypothetical protein [Candidatus Paceibacterota bacterium]